MALSRTHVAVLGGGISGMVSALRLLQGGHRVTIFEASDELGGMGGTFEWEGFTLDKFYHTMQHSDAHLLGLLKELELSNAVVWRRTGTGFLFNGKLFPFRTATDAMRYGGLSVWGRLRALSGIAKLAGMTAEPKGLDEISAVDWLENRFGEEVTSRFWNPLLRSRFGDRYEDVAAQWLWSWTREEQFGVKEVKGYLKGGYGRIVEKLEQEIRNRGGQIRTRTQVSAVQDSPWDVQIQAEGKWESFDAAVSALPMPELEKIARGQVEAALPAQTLAHQGVVNAVVVLKKRLQANYWNAIVRTDYPFQALVETTHVVPPAQTGGRHLVYLVNHCEAGGTLYDQTDGDIRFQALKCLKDFNPAFQADWVEEIKVFRAPYTEPVWPLGYKEARPRTRAGNTRLYLAATAQCYPEVSSWNTMVGIANNTAGRVEFDLANIHKTAAASASA